ncbi:Gfo/Idh/MocA family oxidoreductase [Flavobacterium sp. SUN052]|uniref:Gfo/Idh/MocA family protein n=1 Tax=Flavobacterium sp. SUN052 TaxID=3002441 RepID=UPI00237E0552|nr:Gfo/Idh/MocA family oxidoreductase [Flavobacterium sp. SUN052]MEC4003751.1 Gfo/Idh/MocA family oxidoreductase [Flavobacterium sp. SUN052]
MSSRKLRMGMIGGGRDAFIGSIHRHALWMDGLIEIKCGALSINPESAIESGKDLFLDENRTYTTYQDMISKEAMLPADERIDFVSIVTPNFAHFEPAMMALENGFNVVIEKPITLNLEQAKLLHAKVQETGLRLCLTHTYSGHPMVKQAKAMLKNGDLGAIRKVWVEYPQGWLSKLSEREGNAQAAWRTDPTKSGKSGSMGDIGTHAAHLAEYITGLQITEMCADLTIKVDGRMLDDDGNVLLRFNNGANGVLMASQVAAGEENALKIRVYGEKGGIEWHQMEPNTIILKWLDAPTQLLRAGSNYGNLSPFMTSNCRTPGGHPEGYLEAFANIYRNFALTLMADLKGEKPTEIMLDFPNENDGVRGMQFIENVVASSNSTEKWYPFNL